MTPLTSQRASLKKNYCSYPRAIVHTKFLYISNCSYQFISEFHKNSPPLININSHEQNSKKVVIAMVSGHG